jgi:hypothetical protein
MEEKYSEDSKKKKIKKINKDDLRVLQYDNERMEHDKYHLKIINHYKILYILYIGKYNNINKNAFYELIINYNILINLNIKIYFKFINTINLYEIEKIINDKTKYDILIYINELYIESSIRKNIQHLNEFLNKYKEKKLKNISIIYYINSYNNHNIEYLYNNNSFRRIINFSHVKDFIETDLHYSVFYKCDGQINNTCLIKTPYNKEYNIRLISANLYKSQIWWYKFYINTPYCYFSRFTELSGSRWLNSILNLLLLSDLKFILIELFQNIIESNTKINKINNLNYLDPLYNLKDYLLIIINLILLKKKKIIIIKNYFLLKMACMIIIIDIRKHLKYYLNILNRNYKMYIQKFIDYYNELIKSNKNLLHININEDNKELIKDINKLYNSYTLNKCNTNKYFGNSYNSENGLKVILKILGFSSNETQISFLLNHKNDKHIIFTNNKFKILLRLKVNKDIEYENKYNYQDNMYKLVGSIININWFDNITLVNSYHKLIGLICEDDYYIYDSNNVITYDKWNYNIFNNYKENFYKDPVYKNQIIKHIYIETLIYILI